MIAGLFHAGPILMCLVRERTFGSRLFYGNHADVNRLGLAHGIVIASSADPIARDNALAAA